MRPVNQLPLSLKEMKRCPLLSSLMPDKPPNPGKLEVSTRPLRNCSEPNRTREWSRGSNEGIGRALTSIETGEAMECSSGIACLEDGPAADCARASAGKAASDNPAAADFRKRRRPDRSRSTVMARGCQCRIETYRPGNIAPPRGGTLLDEAMRAGDGSCHLHC